MPICCISCLAIDLGQAAGLAGHLHRELLVQQVGAQVAAGAVHHAALHAGGRVAHALEQLAHEQGLELLGRFLDGLGRGLAGLELQAVQAGAVGGQGLGQRVQCAGLHLRSLPVRRSARRRP